MKRLRITETDRHFSAICPHWLYAAQFRDGVVKVGISKRPSERRRQLCRERRCGVVRFHRSSCKVSGFVAERELIGRLSRICNVAGVSKKPREWFLDLKFGAAATMVEQVARRYNPDMPVDFMAKLDALIADFAPAQKVAA